MELIIKDKVINGDLRNILNKLKWDCHKPYLFKEINGGGNDDNYIITCPFHKEGRENKPSACIYRRKNNPKVEWGKFHCFSCQSSKSLPQLVTDLFDAEDIRIGEDWLYNNFAGDKINQELLPEISLTDNIKENSNINESILLMYDYYHPYMWQRKLTKEVVDRFRIGYDKFRDMITFPVWDEKNNLKMVTARSTKTKHFYIPRDTDRGKYLYLLNFAIQDKTPIIGITEAQIDALTSWGYGFPCCATLGSPTKDQIDLIAKSGIRTIVTMFDNDFYGKEKFTPFITKNLPNSIMVVNTKIPNGKKDINDLSKEEFDGMLKEAGINI